MSDIIIQNESCLLVVGENAIVKSLVVNGEECLAADEEIALFSVTQTRPFNNEVKLAHPNKRTTYQAKSVRREGDRLFVAFEVVPVKANIRLCEGPGYITFTLEGFTVLPTDYGSICMDTPPVDELRLIQLPVKHRQNFGEWLNVVWDDRAAVCVLAASPFARIEQEKRSRCRVMTADAVRSIQLLGCTATLIAAPTDRFMDAMDAYERDYNLPRGVQNRRGDLINASVYWTQHITPDNVDEHIARAKQGGFRLMLIYYTAFCLHGQHGYDFNGNYDFNEDYPNGMSDLAAVLKRIRDAGIHPGFHFLQTHIGLKSRYVTPHADHRLNKTRLFTLARPLCEGDTELFVEQDPTGSVMHPKCRVLQFGGELIGYEGYCAEPPYRFTGISRGVHATEPEAHPLGQIGGILDISEFGATSCYIDQNSSLQDEIAEKLAAIYDLGFQFCYMDGSEGANVPCEVHVPNAQYRVYKRFAETPLFTEGAAKAHFSWHFQAGGNAFDIFPPKIFKEKIVEFPCEEAPRMRQDFTRLDFGWWGFWTPREEDNGMQADMIEYGTSRAAAWDCPVTMQLTLEGLAAHPRTDDMLEVIRRWEDVRATHWLTQAQKDMLKDTKQEHTLLINERGEYELVPYERIEAPKNIAAFLFERQGARYVIYWHERADAQLRLPLDPASFTLVKKLGDEPIAVQAQDGGAVIPADNRRYLFTQLSREALTKAFAQAQVIPAR